MTSGGFSNYGGMLGRLGVQELVFAAVVVLNLAAFVTALAAGVLFGFGGFFLALLTVVAVFAALTVGDAARQLFSKTGNDFMNRGRKTL